MDRLLDKVDSALERRHDDEYRSYHRRPSYHAPAPPVYKEAPAPAPIDFSPLFLALLPMVLALGTLLGLGVSDLSDSSATTSEPISVSINNTAIASGGGTGSGKVLLLTAVIIKLLPNHSCHFI